MCASALGDRLVVGTAEALLHVYAVASNEPGTDHKTVSTLSSGSTDLLKTWTAWAACAGLFDLTLAAAEGAVGLSQPCRFGPHHF